MAFTSSARGPDWTSLPAEILGEILGKLVDISDRIRGASVCKTWFSVYRDNIKGWIKSGASTLPMLLIPTEDNSETHRRLFSVAKGRILSSRLRVPYNKRCCGSSHGWLVFAQNDLTLTLFNPFSGETIQLPPFARQRPWASRYDLNYGIRKVALSEDPSLAPNDYEVLTLFGPAYKQTLALFRAGGKSWIYTNHEDYGAMFEDYFLDITYFRGIFFAVNNWKLVYLDSYDGEAIKLTIIHQETRLAHFSYVVGCGNQLMWIRTYDLLEESLSHVSSLRVYQPMLENGEQVEAVDLQHLNGHALFLGTNQACSVLASDFPGCRPDCIYDMDYWLKKALVRDMKDQSVTLLYVHGMLQLHLPRPIWIVPQANHTNIPLL